MEKEVKSQYVQDEKLPLKEELEKDYVEWYDRPFAKKVDALLAHYGLDWTCKNNEYDICYPLMDAETALDDFYLNWRELMYLWNFTRLVGKNRIELKGKVENPMGKYIKGQDVRLLNETAIFWIMESIADKVKMICEHYGINPYDYDEVENWVKEFDFYKSKSKEKREKEKRKKQSQANAHSAWRLWESLSLSEDCEHWTELKKKCLIHDLMSLHGLIKRRDSFGIFEGADIGNEVKQIERWIKAEGAKPCEEYYDPDEE